MDIVYQYLKKRGHFGAQPLFCEQGPELCDAVAQNLEERKNFILRNPVHNATQNTPSFSEHRVNTIRAEYTSSGADHSEGGWPKDINYHDPEVTQRYRRKIEKEDGYIHCVNMVCPGMEHYILQNNAVDMYRTYYAEMEPVPAVERNSVRITNEYRDPLNRPVCCISWIPHDKHKFAVSYVNSDFYNLSKGPISAFIWDVDRSNHPEQTFTPPALMYDLKFHHKDHNILVGGLATGQVAAFDRRIGGDPTLMCPPHVAHRDLARRILFINSKSGQEFFSGGPDGCCKWWDLRNLEDPIDEMIIDLVKSQNDSQSMATAYGISIMEYEHTIPTRFMVGTDNGLVIGGNRKGKTPMEKLPTKYEAHTGPVCSLERNPIFPKNFLTVGDYTARIWSEDCRESAILWTPLQRHHLTCGAWSPTKVSLSILCGSDGCLTLWDWIRRQSEPVLSMQLSEYSLQAMSFQEKGALVATGDSHGHVILVELSHHLVESGKMDKQLITAVFERESKRERILESRMREIKLKMRQAAEASPVLSTTELDATAGDKDLAEASSEYFQIVKKELANL